MKINRKWLSVRLVLALCLLAGMSAAMTEDVRASGRTGQRTAAVKAADISGHTGRTAARLTVYTAGNVPIDAEHFPDAVFRSCAAGFDRDSDGILSEDECAAVKEIRLSNQGAASLKGVKYFTNLRYLDCSSNPMTSLDVSGMAALRELYCSGGQLKSLNVSGCTALETFLCYQNQLTDLSVSGCTALADMSCWGNQLTSLDVSGCVSLEKMSCNNNQLAGLDVRSCTSLHTLHCANNQLTDLKVHGCAALSIFDCRNNQLTSLDLEGCVKLFNLNCSGNRLKDLDIRGKTQMMLLYCDHNEMEELDLSGCDQRLINCAHMTPQIKQDSSDDIEYLYFEIGTGERITINRDTSLTANGETIYEPKRISRCTITGIGKAVFTGAYITPEPKITDGSKTLVQGVDYTVRYDNNRNVGTASVIIDGAGDYVGRVLKTFAIKPQKISRCTFTAVKAQVYSGKAKKPKPTLSYNGSSVENGRDYTLAYENNTEIGKASIIFTGKGNFTGTAKKTFVINPKAVKISGLTAGPGRFTVKWSKGTGGIGGYQLEYSLKKNFASAKKVTVRKAGTVKTVLKNLKSGRTYYVHIRAFKKVGKKTYCSQWSKAKKGVSQ